MGTAINPLPGHEINFGKVDMAFTFTPPVQVDTIGAPAVDAEAPQVARSGNSVFILWHEFPDPNNAQPDVFISRGTNNNQGLHFQARINLSNTLAGDSREEIIAVSRSGNNLRVYVVWIEDAAKLQFRRDLTNDGTFSNPITINDTIGGAKGPFRQSGVAKGGGPTCTQA